MNNLKVFWSPKCCPSHVESYSNSWRKPSLFVDALRLTHAPAVVMPIDPVDVHDLYAVHSAHYVDSVLAGVAPTGFYYPSKEVAHSMLYTCGAMVSAATHAVSTGESVCAPMSGFHHAGYDHGHGFCTFNGLMVAASRMRYLGKSVGILDYDMHYGDGTDDIRQTMRLGEVAHCGTHTGSPASGDDVLDFLYHLLNGPGSVFKTRDLWLFQAGADIHVDDPLGGLLTTEQMKKRDEIVFKASKEYGVPVVWNLAGGYQERYNLVLDLHLQTVEVFLNVFNQEY